MLPVFFSLWIIFSGKLTLETALLGLVISAVVWWFACTYLGYTLSTDRKYTLLILRVLRYAAVLIWEVIKANYCVLKIIYSGNIKIQPQLIFFKPDLKSTATSVALANSITLTPGTLTVVLDNGLFCVHSLNNSLTKDIDNSVFIKQLRKFEEGR